MQKQADKKRWHSRKGFAIMGFYEAIDPMNDTKFKHFLVRYGEGLNSEYPVSYKFLCSNC